VRALFGLIALLVSVSLVKEVFKKDEKTAEVASIHDSAKQDRRS